MVDDKITFDFNLIKKSGLDFMSYSTLYYLYCRKTKTNLTFVNNFGLLNNLVVKSLFESKFLFINRSENEKGDTVAINIELRNTTYSLFEGDKDYFLEFLSKFPIKTPSGRYLGPKSANTVAGREARKKWNKHFKNDVPGARKAIQVLESEMEWRNKTNKMEFMHNMIIWLNQGDFEKYEYLIEDKTERITKQREDYL